MKISPIFHMIMAKNSTVEVSLLSGLNAKLAVIIIAFAAFTSALMQTLVIPLLVKFPEILNTNMSMVSWLVTAMLLSGAIANVVCGRLGDMFGKRKIMLICLCFLVIGSIIGSLTYHIGWLIFARILQGIAIAVIPLGISCLNDIVHGEDLIKGISIISAMAGMGASLGYIIATTLVYFFDWHMLFVASGLMGLISIIGILWFIPVYTSVVTSSSIDWFGVLGLSIALIGLLLGISKGSSWGWTSFPTWFCLIGSLLIFWFWGKYQLLIDHPLVNLRILKQRPIFLTNFATILIGFAMYGTVLTLPQIIQLPVETGYGLGMPMMMTGIIFLPGTLMSFFIPKVSSWVMMKYSAKYSMITGALLLTLGYSMLFVDHSDYFSLLFAYTFVSCGVFFCFAASPTLIMMYTDKSMTGQVNGLNNLARSIGTTLSSAVITAVITGLIVSKYEFYYPSQMAFLLIFILCAFASLMICVLMIFIPSAHK